jgi:ADP-heptose:LPS heptosyltransferase
MADHVLVVRLDNVGDVLLTGPAVRAVAEKTRVTFLCGPNGVSAARLLVGIEGIIVHRAPWIDARPEPLDTAATQQLIDRVRAVRPDRAIVLTSFHQSALPTALLLRLAGVPFVGAISEDYPGSLLDVRHRVADDIHEVERNLSLVAACGYRLRAGDDARLLIRDEAGLPTFKGLERYVVVHPGASTPARRWDPARSAELVEGLVRRGHRVVVTGSASERELTAGVVGRPRSEVVDLTGKLDLQALAGVVAGADAIVVGNSGPAHLAAAVQTPVVSLYAPTVPSVRWRPWRVPHTLLGMQDIPCAGCRARVCPMTEHPCLSSIETGAVIEAVESLAGRRRVSAAAGATS